LVDARGDVGWGLCSIEEEVGLGGEEPVDYVLENSPKPGFVRERNKVVNNTGGKTLSGTVGERRI